MSNKLRAVFMGSPDFAVPSLAVTMAECDVVAVYTQPDKPFGRGRALAAPAVKTAALAHGLEVRQPPTLRNDAALAALEALACDVAVVVAYGKLLPGRALAAFRCGAINVHGSLLPQYRGAAPVQWSVIDGCHEAGITIMQLDEGMDTGPMLRQVATPIARGETSGELMARLAPLGAEALRLTLRELAAGTTVATPQPAGATHARMLTKRDGAIDFAAPAAAVAARICGVDPWPGAYAQLVRDGAAAEGRATVAAATEIKLFRAEVVAPPPGAGRPGAIVALDGHGATVCCGDGQGVRISEMQLPGKKRMPFAAAVAGRQVAVGDCLLASEHG